jgi:hypothetical protein
MSRDDRKELGEHLDAGQAGLVVAVSDMGAKVEQAMKRASKLEQRRIEADAAEIERDASAAASQRWALLLETERSWRRLLRYSDFGKRFSASRKARSASSVLASQASEPTRLL